MQITAYGATDPGLQRTDNQDTFLVSDLSRPPEDGGYWLGSLEGFQSGSGPGRFEVGPQGVLLLVADGMGGAAAGEIASRLAASTIYEIMTSAEPEPGAAGPEAFIARMRHAAEIANARVHDWSVEHAEYRGMGSTLTSVGLLGGVAHIAQVGDSRAYLVRDGAATQLTQDQTVVQQLIDSGTLTEEDAIQSQHRNVLLQALGTEPDVRVASGSHPLLEGDTLLLCSDGLSGLVEREEIGAGIMGDYDPVGACGALIGLANERGGPDNITVAMARVEVAAPAPSG